MKKAIYVKDDYLTKMWVRKAAKENPEIKKIKAYRTKENYTRIYAAFEYEGVELAILIEPQSKLEYKKNNLKEAIEEMVEYYKAVKKGQIGTIQFVYSYICNICSIDYDYVLPSVISFTGSNLSDLVDEASKKPMSEMKAMAKKIAPLLIKQNEMKKQNQ